MGLTRGMTNPPLKEERLPSKRRNGKEIFWGEYETLFRLQTWYISVWSQIYFGGKTVLYLSERGGRGTRNKQRGEGMGLLSNRISREDLKPGDHIYTWRTAYSYAHHGIYAGDGKVIHFTQGRGEEMGTGTVLDLLLLSSGPSHSPNGCQACDHHQDKDRVICSCLHCFLAGGALYRFEYAVNPALFLAKARGGTCTLAEADPPETVLHRAKYLLQNGFGYYHIFKNNCEDFAIYCKTGLLVLEGISIGRSGQVASIVGAFVTVFSSPLRFLTTSTPGLTVVACGLYCFSRYATDMGIRRDVAKVPVENLIIRPGVIELQLMSAIVAAP